MKRSPEEFALRFIKSRRMLLRYYIERTRANELPVPLRIRFWVGAMKFQAEIAAHTGALMRDDKVVRDGWKGYEIITVWPKPPPESREK